MRCHQDLVGTLFSLTVQLSLWSRKEAPVDRSRLDFTDCTLVSKCTFADKWKLNPFYSFFLSLYLLLGVDEISLCVGEKCNSKTPLGNLHDLPLFYTFEKKILQKACSFSKESYGWHKSLPPRGRGGRPKIVRFFPETPLAFKPSQAIKKRCEQFGNVVH